MKTPIAILTAATAALLAANAHARPVGQVPGGLGPGGCVNPPPIGKAVLRSLNREAFFAQRNGVMPKQARYELTKQAATIYKAINHRETSAVDSANGSQQLTMLKDLTRHVRYAPGGRVEQVGLRSILHGQQLRFQTGSGGLVGTSESFVKLEPGVPSVAQGVRTARTGSSSSRQLEIIGRPTSFLGPR